MIVSIYFRTVRLVAQNSPKTCYGKESRNLMVSKDLKNVPFESFLGVLGFARVKSFFPNQATLVEKFQCKFYTVSYYQCIFFSKN